MSVTPGHCHQGFHINWFKFKFLFIFTSLIRVNSVFNTNGMASLTTLTVTIVLVSIFDISDGKFAINYTENSFYMDGKPFRYVSGSFHYLRVPHEYWKDSMRKLRAAGLNAVSTYVEWNLHEPQQGIYNFEDDHNITNFIELAQEENLYVILRVGPYICAERDMGGLPYWLITESPGIRLRTNDSNFKKYVSRWFGILFEKVTPLLHGNGGPIILVQVENEYGSYNACDKDYTIWLRDLIKSYVKDNAVLFTTDGPSSYYLKCGKIPDVYATVDFNSASDVNACFKAQREYEKQGPLVNSEFYTGWLTHWGEKTARTSAAAIAKTLDEMLQVGANVNFYMFRGGTNFAFTAGANIVKTYVSDITSYDYDAPITEAGDLTEKYFAIKEVVRKYLPIPDNYNVTNSTKANYGEVVLPAVGKLFAPKIREMLGVTHHNYNPLPFEAVHQSSGYLLYETILKFTATQANLKIEKYKDLMNIYLNEQHKGTLDSTTNSTLLGPLDISPKDTLSIVAENLGRISIGNGLRDSKGILSPVYLKDEKLTSWNMTSFEFNNINSIEKCVLSPGADDGCLNGGGYTFYAGKFYVPPLVNDECYPPSTFLDVSMLKKGVAFVNGRNLGRHWSMKGPQHTLYVPGAYLKPFPAENLVVIMDEVISERNITAKFIDHPIFAN